MKNSFKYIFLIFWVVGTFWCPIAQSDVFIEPFISQESGSLKDNDLSTDFKFDSLNYGGRLGLKTLGFGVGFEYSGGEFELKDSPFTKYNSKNIGAFISYDFPIIFRMYFSYFVTTELELISNTEEPYDLKGEGTRVGLGFPIFSFFSINLEFINKQFDNMKLNTQDSKVDYSIQTTALSLSFPISL